MVSAGLKVGQQLPEVNTPARQQEVSQAEVLNHLSFLAAQSQVHAMQDLSPTSSASTGEHGFQGTSVPSPASGSGNRKLHCSNWGPLVSWGDPTSWSDLVLGPQGHLAAPAPQLKYSHTHRLQHRWRCSFGQGHYDLPYFWHAQLSLLHRLQLW